MARTMLDEIRNIVSMATDAVDEEIKTKHLLYSIFKPVAAAAHLTVIVSSTHCLKSNRDILDITGNADFVLQLGDKYVCVMLAKKDINLNGEGSSEDDFESGDGDIVKREVENELAQTVMVMEIISTYATRRYHFKIPRVALY
ncbi:hypothetical protein PPTG_05755 [Phytophthora nicotianae INRA-310]|uniref:Uncharacterized protein n=4 Tax=Phytophthora nicotianae TaxID=4792 RepID=W2QVR0_PHYN3|nr:hypothetical protein PPTG_05755 [Phytophthora nicotianae INRA-310]ETI32836.1 hypothetical protein F443_20424 [Phytophthora nicotianae P1569]ETL26613.1 hypothetical protein L916_19745 [Phytophthora nicotianae]ETO61532.1 hypothetical protein F444_20438 [Phytophthora nicotianae P1976]KUG01589.1 hypothetical protein AM587_10007329 [Phytophthora nicotianae]ETN16574.1 hypothetical protein PPTG_05755 [Phytophthora nicotianae INRA-310]